jgi:hypothetical protein
MRLVMVDEPSPFATLEVWERHLADLKALPIDTVLRPEMIMSAEKMITRKRRQQWH